MQTNFSSGKASETAETANSPALSPNHPPVAPPPHVTPAPRKKGVGWLLFFGVFWPGAVLLIEMYTGMAAEIWIDPIPTYLHVAIVAWAPISNLLLIRKIAAHQKASAAFLMWHALGAGISIIYWLIFFPFSMIGVLLFWTGFGMLPMAPMVATFAAASARQRYYNEHGHPSRARDGFLGVCAGIALVAALEIPTLGAAYGLTLAVNGDDAQRARGRWILNYLASESTLARYAAGENSQRMSWYLEFVETQTSLAKPARDQTAREVFRATGKGLEQVTQKRFGWDQNQGGTAVGVLIPQLALSESRAEAAIDAADGLSYTEWTMVFQSSSGRQTEARAEILLPPGGVVSRLTLWVNGEEREAAFAGSGKVRAAYQKVVTARRDPVLVTMSAPGRALVQCYPVPPGGSMKIRFGVTAPLEIAGQDSARFTLPNLTHQNFLTPEKTTLSLRGKNLRAPAGFTAKTDQAGTFFTRDFKLTDKSFSMPVAVGNLQGTQWVRDNRDGVEGFVTHRARSVPGKAARVVVVVDGSALMDNHASRIAKALAVLPGARVLLAGDGEPREIRAEDLRHVSFQGGADNVLALRAASLLAKQNRLDTILWIHGPQPAALTDVASLNLVLNEGTRIVDIPLEAGRNAILEKLFRRAQVETIPLTAESNRVLETTTRRLAGLEPTWERVYDKAAKLPPDAAAQEGSFHIARLWANQEVNSLIRAQRSNEAINLAQRYQLVTAVSGAVVLETAAQFKEAGLSPVDATTVPVVPEPATIALLASGAALLFAKRRRS